MNVQSSDRVSAIAARLLDTSAMDVANANPVELASDIRSLAASVLRQDETKGLRRLFRKMTGRA